MTLTPTNRMWLETIATVLNHGLELRQENRVHAPRDITMKEVLCHAVSVPMSEPVVTIGACKLDYKFMCAEAAVVLSGDNHVSGFSDDGYTFSWHYGTKYIDQAGWVAATLAKDNATRQAVLSIWRDDDGDIPCTLSLQWLIRDQTLHCISTIRSSNVWAGLPYDVHMFSSMSAHLALILRKYHGVEVELGTLWNTAGSRHLYLRDWEVALNCLDPLMSTEVFKYVPLNLREFDHPDKLIQHYWTLVKGDQVVRHRWLTEAF